MLIKAYYEGFIMKFRTERWDTKWIKLEKGIPMGCTISPILFVMAMNVVLSTVQHTEGVELNGRKLPPVKAFMDDMTVVCRSAAATRAVLEKLEKAINWARMRVKPVKSRGMMIRFGRISSRVKFSIDGQVIPSVSEKPVKSLGRWFDASMSDRRRMHEIRDTFQKYLSALHVSGLRGVQKVWGLHHLVVPRILWPLTMYDVAMTTVETMQRKMAVWIRKWLGVPRTLSQAALFSNECKLSLPTESLVTEFKVNKVRVLEMLKSSPDEAVRDVNCLVETGRKWSAEECYRSAESRLRHDEVVGMVQCDRRGLGWQRKKWWSKATGKDKRELVTTEVRRAEEESWKVAASSQPQQGAWMRWEEATCQRMSWKDLLGQSRGELRFLIRATYDLLPTPANLKKWKVKECDRCECGQRGTLHHILCACPNRLSGGMYTWRHNEVLKVLHQAVVKAIERNREQEGTKVIQFVREGQSVPKVRRKDGEGWTHLSIAKDWQVSCDVNGGFKFPPEIGVVTQLRPDLVIWSISQRACMLVELTVPWEDRMEEAYERKMDRYIELTEECRFRDWRVNTLPVEVGCRGFVGLSMIRFLKTLGLGKEAMRTEKDLSETARRGSAWIWSRSRLSPNNG